MNHLRADVGEFVVGEVVDADVVGALHGRHSARVTPLRQKKLEPYMEK